MSDHQHSEGTLQGQNQATKTTSFDAGLRKHFSRVYSIMAMGLVITGATAFALSNIQPLMNLVFGTPLVYAVMFAPMIFLMFGFTPARIMRKSAAQLNVLFYVFCGLMGLCFSAIFLYTAGADITRAFFVTAATFMATSIYGYTTKADLSKMQSFLIMGSIGILIAIVANLFIASSALDFVISVVGVLVYTLWTAFHTQAIKESYSATYGTEANNKAALIGALNLYVDFIMLFQFILSLMSGRE